MKTPGELGVRKSVLGLLGTLASMSVNLACNRGSDLTVRDSEGRNFRVHAEGALPPHIELSPTPSGKFVLRFESRIVGACAAAESGAIESTADCRPIVCDTDSECPRDKSGVVACMKGLCVVEAHPIDVSDAAMLCLSGTGVGHDIPEQVERFALAQNCGNPCQVPTACRQP